MENIAHTLVGYSLSKAGLQKTTPYATAALMIGANLPDVEVAGSLFGANYLDSHRGVSHSAAGILVLSVGLAGAFWIVSRIRRTGARERLKLFPLWYVSFLGLLSHPLLDFLNDYGLRPWLPFNSRKYYGDLLSIVDPWLWLIFGSAAFLMTASRRGRIRWAVLGSILALLVGGSRPARAGSAVDSKCSGGFVDRPVSWLARFQSGESGLAGLLHLCGRPGRGPRNCRERRACIRAGTGRGANPGD